MSEKKTIKEVFKYSKLLYFWTIPCWKNFDFFFWWIPLLIIALLLDKSLHCPSGRSNALSFILFSDPSSWFLPVHWISRSCILHKVSFPLICYNYILKYNWSFQKVLIIQSSQIQWTKYTMIGTANFNVLSKVLKSKLLKLSSKYVSV